MALVGEPFRHDILFSYAHADAHGQGSPKIKEWCQQFHTDLRDHILIFPEYAELNFYLDENERANEKLAEGQAITEGLRRAAGGAALLCAMMSPWYLSSEWCGYERDWWSGGEGRLKSCIDGESQRAFVCEIMETDPSSWPGPLKDIKAHTLFDKSKDKHQRIPLGLIGTEEDKAAYKEMLVKVAGALMSRLTDIKAKLEAERLARASQAKLLDAVGQTLFLHARADLADAFDTVCARLDDYVVLPANPLDLSRNGRFSDDLNEDLEASDAMLVVGKDHRRLDTDMVIAGRNARRLAQARSYKRLPCAVFDIEGRANHPPRRIKNAENLGIAWIDGTRDDWHGQMRSWLLATIQTEGVAV